MTLLILCRGYVRLRRSGSRRKKRPKPRRSREGGKRVSAFGDDPSRKMFGATRRGHSVPRPAVGGAMLTLPRVPFLTGLAAALGSHAPLASLSLMLDRLSFCPRCRAVACRSIGIAQEMLVASGTLS